MCNSFASDAVTFNISPSNKINGSVKSCSVARAPTTFVLNKANALLDASVGVYPS